MPYLLLLLLTLAACMPRPMTTNNPNPPTEENELTRQDLRAAARVAGLDFSDAELDSLQPGVNDFRANYEQLRQHPIPNDISPALVFDPLPSGFVLPAGPDGVTLAYPRVTRPAQREALAFLSLLELGALLRSGQVTSVELTEFFLARLRQHDPQLYCVISLTDSLALAQARRADTELARGQDRGPLHGIPYGAKDLLATRTYRTTWGATPYRDQAFDYDATVVQRLETAGAVLVAKLTLGALAWGDVWYGGTTRNPWQPTTGSSGSSAGSAAAVAAGLVPFAIGTETLGSIVSPATVCGTTGLRPTFGRVSRHGAMALCWSMDKIGPLTRSAEDALLVLDAMVGPDGQDKSVRDVPLYYTDAVRADRQLRIGYVASDFAQDYPFKSQDSAALVVLRQLGYQLIPIELPKFPPLDIILSVEAATAFDELTRSHTDSLLVRQVRNAWPNVFREARLVPAVEYLQANRERTRLIETMEREVFSQVDLYVHPSWASASLRITNYTGHPCLVVPNGFRSDGRPTSISFTGKLFGEALLVAVGEAFQRATEWEDRHPPGF